jgi:TonB family protein
MREACASEHAVHHVESAEAAVELLLGGRCGIFIADLGTLHGNAVPLLLRLNAQFPELILMATGRREEEGGVTPLVSSGRVFRFLHKPISPPRAQLFIGAATRRYQEMRAFEPMALATVRTVRTMASRSPIRRYAAGAAAVLAILAGVVLWHSNERRRLSPVFRATTTAPTTQEQIADYLARANIALATGRLVEPKGDNALEFYQRVLALQPNHRDAKFGIQRTIDALAKRIDSAVTNRNSRLASSLLAQLEHVQPSHPRLTELRVSIASLQRVRAPTLPVVTQESVADSAAMTDDATALAKNEASATQEVAAQAPSSSLTTPAEPSAAPDQEVEIAEDLSIAARLRERGVLIDPPGDNAFEHLLELRTRSPESESVRAEQQRLASALLERARTALAANDLESSERLLKAADTLIPGTNSVRSLQEQVTAARAQASTNTIIQAALVPRRKEVSASYPLEALRDSVEGWVDVEFTIASTGDTQDLVVRDADPREVFEKAALDAVKRWKFVPIVRDGAAVSQRAILRVRFSLARDARSP